MKSILFLIMVLPLTLLAQTIAWEIFPPSPADYVTDEADVLSLTEEERLNVKLRAFEDSTSNQLFIYVAKGLRGKNLEEVSRNMFNTWGIGQKDKNNGILIAIFLEDHLYRIQIGSGLEKALTSELTLHIQDDEMRPHFRDNEFYEGIDAGVDQLIYYSKNEYTAPSPYYKLRIPLAVSSVAGVVLFILNFLSLKKWKNQPARRTKFIVYHILALIFPVISLLVIPFFKGNETQAILFPAFASTFCLILLRVMVTDKNSVKYDYETDDAYERRMYQKSQEASSDSDDSVSGGGGSSTNGGSSSSW